MDQKRVFTVEEVRKTLNIGRNSVYKLVRQASFPKIYVGKKILIPIDEFENWIREQSHQYC